MLESLGLHAGAEPTVERVSGRDAGYWMERANTGALILIEGKSPLGEALGIVPVGQPVPIQALADPSDPALEIIWEHPVHVPVFEVPAEARVFARDSATKSPLLATIRVGTGAVIWTATPIGEKGYERYPMLPQALLAAGLDPPLRSNRLWAFFDSSYRTRADLDYFAALWRESGVGALHVAAWHYWEPDAERDAFLARLIEACHRNAIAVYAWLEFPHVSEKFWAEHPEWREQTAAGQDAHLDWRKLMNLLDPDCERAVWEGTQSLMRRFDWDGINLAELYFESLEGAANPARFTPMNALVRERVRRELNFEPMDAFASKPDRMQDFLDWRAGQARSLQQTWLAKAEVLRAEQPDLDIVLTHVDDRFEPDLRNHLGADAAAALGLLQQHDFTFLVEDPATIWNLGPARYPEIARRYVPITPRPKALAVDINVVERYQNVYPTKLQAGAELAQLVHAAAESFPRVALYFESSVRRQDYPLLPLAAAQGTIQPASTGLAIESEQGAVVRWSGPLRVDGRAWPATDGEMALIPPGHHTLTPGAQELGARLLDLTGTLQHAHIEDDTLEFAYTSQSRAFAVVSRKPVQAAVDSIALPSRTATGGNWLLTLPRGQHLVTLRFQ